MIIWSRWGGISMLGILLAIPLALGTANLLNTERGMVIGTFVFLYGAAFNLALAYLVFPHLDKPRPVTFTRPLPQPVQLPDGSVRTHETVPALDPEGRQIWQRPSSSLFFIPSTVIWIPLAGIGVVLAVAALLGR